MRKRKPTDRMDDVDATFRPPMVIVHVKPGETPEEAHAAYEREHGPIPEDARVEVVVHTFWSSI